MAGLDENVRKRTDALDSLGNTTAATGKGFAIGSAALTALALIASYVEKIQEVGGSEVVLDMSVMNPTVLVGIFIGSCLPFVFAALTMDSVGRAAQSIVAACHCDSCCDRSYSRIQRRDRTFDRFHGNRIPHGYLHGECRRCMGQC